MTEQCREQVGKNRKLKIAMLGHKRIPSREGGIEIVVEELAKRMVQKGHNVTCYNRKGKHVSGVEFAQTIGKEYHGIKLKSVFTVDAKGLAAVTSSFFANIKAAFGKYDVVHVHAEGPAAFCWIPRLFGKRVIFTVHGLDWARAKWQGGFGAKYIRLGEKMGVRYSDEMIVLSRGVQEYFKKTYVRETTLIPNGVNRPSLINADMISEKYNLHKDEYILFLGRLVPEKGVHYLIEAFKQVETDKKLVIAGGTSDSNDFVKEIRDLAKGDERILFTGFVQGSELEELYSNAYIYVLPSDLEGMPLSLLEAMSYGNCCLVSDISECADVVEDKAVTFLKGNVTNLKEKLQWLCDRQDIVEDYKREVADYICGKYNWDEIVDRTLELYENLDDK